MPPARESSLADITCGYCRHEGPDGVFCANCGAHRGEEGPSPTRRRQHFAAHPGEHVFQPSLFTTIFPHLGHRKVYEFRAVFLGALAGVLILYFAGLITIALCVSVVLLPILYVLYLYEAQVYKEEPLLVIAALLLVSVGVGVGVTIGTDRLLPQSSQLTLAVTGSALATVGIWIPLIQETAKPLAAVALRFWPAFRDETMDGLVFGIAAGLGFGVGESFVRLSTILRDLPLHTTPGNWVYPLVSTAVLLPFLQGTTTGLVCAALWRFGRGCVDTLSVVAIAFALTAHVGFSLVSQVLENHGWSQLPVLAWQLLVDLALLVYMRALLHAALLEEARDIGLAVRYCPHCHARTTSGGFCPRCGLALTAVPWRLREEPA